MTRDNNVMHAKPDLRVFLKWMSGSVITDVIRLKGSACEPLRSTEHAWDHKEAYRSQPMAFDASSIGSRCSDCSLVRN